MEYVVYTDGACSVSKCIGGYAAIACFDGQQIVLHGNEKNATNNEMELLAVVSILHVLERIVDKQDSVIIHSDSAYVVNAINQRWLKGWVKNSWQTSEGRPVKNKRLWSELLYCIDYFDNIGVKCTFVKVKGHSDCKLNNYVDRLAVKETERLKNKQLED